MSEWQPIATAPTNRRILIVQQDVVTVAKYVDTSWNEDQLIRDNGQERTYRVVHHRDGYWGNGDDVYCPTHWMELPDPPDALLVNNPAAQSTSERS